MITGLLSWYDEDPSDLMDAVRSAAAVVDALVAVDGAYAMFPGASDHPRSPGSNARGITAAARTIDLPVLVYTPNEPWLTESVKRTFAFRLGQALTPPSGWLLIFDADERVWVERPFAMPDEFLVGFVTIVEPGQRPLDGRRLFRAGRDPLVVGPAHYAIRREWFDGPVLRSQWYADSSETHPVVSAGPSGIFISHVGDVGRSPDRIARKTEYYRRRDEAGIEAMT